MVQQRRNAGTLPAWTAGWALKERETAGAALFHFSTNRKLPVIPGIDLVGDFREGLARVSH